MLVVKNSKGGKIEVEDFDAGELTSAVKEEVMMLIMLRMGYSPETMHRMFNDFYYLRELVDKEKRKALLAEKKKHEKFKWILAVIGSVIAAFSAAAFKGVFRG